MADTAGLEDREPALSRIVRYRSFSPMFYRTDVGLHSRRVQHMVDEIIPSVSQVYGDIFNPSLASALALVHDDVEIVTGDVERWKKNRMTQEEKDAHYRKELQAIELLADIYPKDVKGCDYRTLLLHSVEKDCLEAHLVSFVDKLDAFCESLHEIFAGNRRFKRTVEHYVQILNDYPKTFPTLSRAVPSAHPFLSLPDGLNAEGITTTGSPHDISSINMPTGIPAYDAWKELSVRYFSIGHLTEQKEFN